MFKQIITLDYANSMETNEVISAPLPVQATSLDISLVLQGFSDSENSQILKIVVRSASIEQVGNLNEVDISTPKLIISVDGLKGQNTRATKG